MQRAVGLVQQMVRIPTDGQSNRGDGGHRKRKDERRDDGNLVRPKRVDRTHLWRKLPADLDRPLEAHGFHIVCGRERHRLFPGFAGVVDHGEVAVWSWWDWSFRTTLFYYLPSKQTHKTTLARVDLGGRVMGPFFGVHCRAPQLVVWHVDVQNQW